MYDTWLNYDKYLKLALFSMLNFLAKSKHAKEPKHILTIKWISPDSDHLVKLMHLMLNIHKHNGIKPIKENPCLSTTSNL